MKHVVRRILLLIVVLLLALTTGAIPALAKGPRIMMVYGTPLVRPIVISNWRDTAELMIATNDSMSTSHARLQGRPSLHVAMFWGMQWVHYMQQHKSLAALRPRQADQFARLYPAYGTAPALFVFDSIPGPYTSLIRRIGPQGLAVLARDGIPVRLPK
jgi:hypothetical protein